MAERPTFQLSLDTQALVRRLLQVRVGELINYNELQQALPRGTRLQSALQSARHVVMRDHQYVFGTIRMIGLRRLSDPEIVASGVHTFGVIRRAAHRGVRRVSSVTDFGALSNEDKIKHNATLSLLGAVALIARPRQVERLETAVTATAAGRLSFDRTLQLFSRRRPEED